MPADPLASGLPDLTPAALGVNLNATFGAMFIALVISAVSGQLLSSQTLLTNPRTQAVWSYDDAIDELLWSIFARSCIHENACELYCIFGISSMIKLTPGIDCDSLVSLGSAHEHTVAYSIYLRTLDTFHLACTAHSLYKYLILDFENLLANHRPTWSLLVRAYILAKWQAKLTNYLLRQWS